MMGSRGEYPYLKGSFMAGRMNKWTSDRPRKQANISDMSQGDSSMGWNRHFMFFGTSLDVGMVAQITTRVLSLPQKQQHGKVMAHTENG